MSVIIGITGSIASGKTTLLKYMIEKGYPVFICDDYVKKLYKDPEVISKISASLPNIDLSDRKAIAKIIYNNPEKKKELEQILHPRVRKAMREFMNSHEKDQIIFLEVPLLFESKLDKNCNYTITLLCSANIRKQRAFERGIPQEIFRAIDKAQMPELEKKALASYSIDTSGNLKDVASEFEKIIASLPTA